MNTKNNLIALRMAGVIVAVMAAPQSRADSIYVANSGSHQLQLIDTVTSTITNLFTTASKGGPNGLILHGPNDVIYTTGATGTVSDYNLSTHTNSTLVDLVGVTHDPNVSGQYLTLDPGGASALIGTSSSGLYRYNFSTSAVTSVLSLTEPRGLAYDASGRLFAVLSPDTLAQIDPITGATINSIDGFHASGSSGANGLAFDPVTGDLFVTDDTNDVPHRGLYEIPTNLSSATLVAQGAGFIGQGLRADGRGDLFIADLNNLAEYNVADHTLTIGVFDPVLSDLALAPSVVGTPEPASLLLLGLGLCAIGGFRRWSKKRNL